MTFGPVPPSPDFTTSGWSSSLREKFFFVVGMIILPPFWSWWTLRRGFSERQREVAFTWCTLYLIAVLATWNLMEPRYVAVALGCPFILAWLNLCLGAWLFWRVSTTFLEPLMMLVILGPHLRYFFPPYFPTLFLMAGFGILCALHLSLEPGHRALRRFQRWSAPWLAKYHLRW